MILPDTRPWLSGRARSTDRDVVHDPLRASSVFRSPTSDPVRMDGPGSTGEDS